MKCRHCGEGLSLIFADLGSAPPSNAYLTSSGLNAPEKWFPLKVLTCSNCWLVQTEDYAGAEELFTDEYAYFSSCSSTWLAHAAEYAKTVSRRFNLNAGSNVVEVASNDGYLLQHFKRSSIPCLGIEPTKNTARAAVEKGIETIEAFFTLKLAIELVEKGKSADLMVANNVLAHVPDINDFVAGFSALLKPGGAASFEFPHVLNLVEFNLFDTIYHEHYSYLSLTAVNRIFNKNGLMVFDVETLPTHGGSLRVFACRLDAGRHKKTERVDELLETEAAAGLAEASYYENFQPEINKVKNDFLSFLITAFNDNKKTIGYGAAAKGNTLLNYAGVRSDLIPFVADISPAKQGKYLPGSRIPVLGESSIRQYEPDYVIIFPWNLKQEVMKQLFYIRQWGGKFVVAVPSLEVL